jgi:hypothetical protein
MRGIILSAGALVLGLAVAATAQAGGKNGGISHGPSTGSYHNYHVTHGTQFKYGNFYKGRFHYHWNSWCWNTKYNCYFYWCPSTCCYYYWNEPSCCYFPVSYLQFAPPTAFPTTNAAAAAAANATNKNTQIVNVVTAPNAAAGNGGVPSAVPIPPAPTSAVATAAAGEVMPTVR